MKTANIPLYVGIPLIGLGLMATFGDFLPASTTRANDTKEIPAEVQQGQDLYDSINSDLTEAIKTEELAKMAYEQSIKVHQSIQLTLCAQQIVLGQTKYKYMDLTDEETTNLQKSIAEAQSCLNLR